MELQYIHKCIHIHIYKYILVLLDQAFNYYSIIDILKVKSAWSYIKSGPTLKNQPPGQRQRQQVDILVSKNQALKV